MSAFGDKADLNHSRAKGPLLAKRRHCDAGGWEPSTASNADL